MLKRVLILVGENPFVLAFGRKNRQKTAIHLRLRFEFPLISQNRAWSVNPVQLVRLLLNDHRWIHHSRHSYRDCRVVFAHVGGILLVGIASLGPHLYGNLLRFCFPLDHYAVFSHHSCPHDRIRMCPGNLPAGRTSISRRLSKNWKRILQLPRMRRLRIRAIRVTAALRAHRKSKTKKGFTNA